MSNSRNTTARKRSGVFGPGLLVSAAFIGPGTVTACTLAGANFGTSLLWVLVVATIATIILQDMAARLGVGAGLGLGEALLKISDSAIVRGGVVLLVFAALAIGNSAYEGGNLSGAALGVEAIFSGLADHRRWVVIGLGSIAAAALLTGRYHRLERILIALVIVMSLAFVAAGILVRPDLGAILSGLRPQIPDGATLTVLALIGTTIVPYNLFLHAAASQRKWSSADELPTARLDSAFSIGLGGLVSILILTTSATVLFGSALAVSNAADMAIGIEPVFGSAARYFVGIGLLAAGLTSAITAPMATAYALSELTQRRDPTTFKLTALAIVLIGTTVAAIGIRPVQLIFIAQFANGLLLPIIASFLLFVMNKKSLLREHTNGPISNVLGGLVVLLTIGLGARVLARLFGVM